MSTRLEPFPPSCCSKQCESILAALSTSLLLKLLPLTEVSPSSASCFHHWSWNCLLFPKLFSVRISGIDSGGNGRTLKTHVSRHSRYSPTDCIWYPHDMLCFSQAE
jgi:hypothetical protein